MEKIGKECDAVVAGNFIVESLEKLGARELVGRKEVASEGEAGVVRDKRVGKANAAKLFGVLALFKGDVALEKVAEKVEITAGLADIVEIAESNDFLDVELSVGVLVHGSGDFASAVADAAAMDDPTFVDRVRKVGIEKAISSDEGRFHTVIIAPIIVQGRGSVV